MNTKLTLSLDKSVIEKAKDYAKEHQVSLSKLIESYLSLIIRKENSEELEVSPELKNIGFDIDRDGSFNFKEDYGDYLSKKHA